MQDTVRHGALQSDEVRHTLTVRDVEALLAQAGVQRSHRHVLRMCQSGMLDAVKTPGGPTGEEWLVAPASVPKAIGDLKYFDTLRGRRSGSQPAVSHHVADEMPPKINTDAASHSVPQPAVAEKESRQKGSETEPATARYVTLLERDNEFLREQVSKKDEQITDLSKRFGETQTLLGAMQRMLAPLLGQSDPFKYTEKREADDPASAQ